MELHKKIRKLVEKKSADCITSKQLVGVLDDDNVFADEAKPYKELLRDIIVKGYSQRLLNLGEYSSEVSQLARQYAQSYARNEECALYVFDCLAYGLGWKKDEPILKTVKADSRTQSSSQTSTQKKPSVPEQKVYVVHLPQQSQTTFSPKVSPSISQTNPTKSEIPKKTKSRKNYLKEDFVWLKENASGVFFAYFAVCALAFVISLVVIIVGWVADTGHAPMWTWLLWESLAIGIVSLVVSVSAFE